MCNCGDRWVVLVVAALVKSVGVGEGALSFRGYHCVYGRFGEFVVHVWMVEAEICRSAGG